VAENLLPRIEEHPDRVAMTDDHGSTTWADANDRVNRLIHAFRDAGIGTGDRVAILSNNRREMFEAVNAAGHSGTYSVPMNWHFAAEEIRYVLEDSGSVALVADHEFADAAAEASAGVDLRLRTMFGGEPPDGFVEYEELLASAPGGEPADQSSGSTMFYTSGTTGRPKGVKSSLIPVGSPASTLQFVLEAFGGILRFPKGGDCLVMAPAYHSGPFATAIVAAALGSTVHLRRKFDPEDMLRVIEELRITSAYAVPTHFVRLLRLPDEIKQKYDVSSLGYVLHTAAPCPPEVKKAMIEWWGPVIFEGYGATEGGFVTFVSSQEYLDKPGTIGTVLPTHELLVVGEDGEHLGTGEVGQLYFRSVMGTDFEYHNAPEKTEEAHLEPGVFTFGDVGYVDDDGFVFLSDRKIDMIISGGVNIYPAEIESVLVTHPAVADVAVFGVPNEEFGEEVKAVVELAEGNEPSDETASEIQRFCREHMAGYKVPRSVDFVEVLPRTPTGKLLKRTLRDPYWEAAGRAI
jgi:long-chain acyl-CoA synthetase